VKSAIIGILVSPLLMAQQNGVAWTNIGPTHEAVEAIAVARRALGLSSWGLSRVISKIC
jgi:hypothetical protein